MRLRLRNTQLRPYILPVDSSGLMTFLVSLIESGFNTFRLPRTPNPALWMGNAIC